MLKCAAVLKLCRTARANVMQIAGTDLLLMRTKDLPAGGTSAGEQDGFVVRVPPHLSREPAGEWLTRNGMWQVYRRRGDLLAVIAATAAADPIPPACEEVPAPVRRVGPGAYETTALPDVVVAIRREDDPAARGRHRWAISDGMRPVRYSRTLHTARLEAALSLRRAGWQPGTGS